MQSTMRVSEVARERDRRMAARDALMVELDFYLSERKPERARLANLEALAASL